MQVKQNRLRSPSNPYKKQVAHIAQIWRRDGRGTHIFGIERIFLLGLLVFLMAMPAMAIRAVGGRNGLLGRKIAIESYAVLKPCLLSVLLASEFRLHWWAVSFAILMLADMFSYLLGIVFLREFWSQPVSYSRSLLLLGVNWIEFIVCFALIYVFCGCLCSGGIAVTNPSDAFFFSAVTAATVGFGDIVPSAGIGRAICSVQILCSFVFIGMFVAHFVGNIGEKRKEVT